MYVAIDFGGTKTLIGIFDSQGNLHTKHKFETTGNYTEYIDLLCQELNQLEGFKECEVIAMAIPAPINYSDQTARLSRKMGDGWSDRDPIVKDLSDKSGKKVMIENDGNLAALSEARHGAGQGFEHVLYITLSTGIGTGFISGGSISADLRRSEGGFMVLPGPDGQLGPWEYSASGKAFFEQYGNLGSEVDDEHIWREYARKVAPGVLNAMAITQPDVVVIGGGMGANLNKFQHFLEAEIEALRYPPVPMVPIKEAAIPNDAVLYGCYEFATSNS